jgi:hypothetical protein
VYGVVGYVVADADALREARADAEHHRVSIVFLLLMLLMELRWS